MLSLLARFHWVFARHDGMGIESWAYYSPGVRRNYEPLYWPEWNRKDAVI